MNNSESNRMPLSVRDIYSPEHPVTSFVEAVFVRPKMYTMYGTLAEAAAFLTGFYSGMAQHNRSERAQDEVEHWYAFCHWAAEQLGGTSTSPWTTTFELLHQAYPTDTVAFARIAMLYIEFRQQDANKLYGDLTQEDNSTI